jgi:4-hydroxy-2-oxoheptanedioate aldolase
MTAPRPYGLADRLYAGETVFCAWLGTPEPFVAESLAREGFDAIAFDMQHSTIDLMSVMRGITGVFLAGKPSIVRLALNDFGTGARLLDTGAECIIAPMINNAADARRFVEACKYPPIGERSWGGARIMQLSGMDANSYIQASHKMCVTLAMIETVEAMNNVDEILAVDGIDGVFAGPSDISLTLSKGAEMNPLRKDVEEAFAMILAASKKAGKLSGCFSPNYMTAKGLADKGWGLISVITDGSLFKIGAQTALKAARGE